MTHQDSEMVEVGTLSVYRDSEATFGFAYDISTNYDGHKALQSLDGAKLYIAASGATSEQMGGAQVSPVRVAKACAHLPANHWRNRMDAPNTESATAGLLEALQWIVDNPGAHPNNVQWVAKAAIAKATGKQIQAEMP